MSTTSADKSPPAPLAGTSPAWLSFNFAATILVSAFLLFQVQPMISKYILPWFGGSPAVWTTCMLFFQMLLFGGYAYAHLTARFLAPRPQALLHVALLVTAAVLLPITPSDALKPTDSDNPIGRILALLGMTVGLPYFVLSSTGPLVQHWFSGAFPGRSPYRLYSLSNLGSLTALLTYPFLVEPTIDVVLQTQVWSGLFVVFALLCAVGGLVTGWRSTARQEASEAQATITASDIPTVAHRLLWIALPAFASMTMLATTNQVCIDVAVIPFLWIIPLSLYLLSFIICFDHARWYARGAFAVATGLLILAVAGNSELSSLVAKLWREFSFVEELILFFGAMFCVCMVCHGEMVRLRPHPRFLTEYYLMLSAGGALGGLFVSLIAPEIFSNYFEWNIVLVGSWLLAVVMLVIALARGRLPLALVAVGLVGAGVGLWFLYGWQGTDVTPLARDRNFYGVISVVDIPERKLEGDQGVSPAHRRMYNDHVIHGLQHLDPAKKQLPLSYYHQATGIHQAIRYLHQRQKGIRIGVVGLGVGTVATFAEEGDSLRFYEINPECVLLAEDFFTFLHDCKVRPEPVVLGDGRLQLELELKRGQPQKFDILLLDAFSGHAVPAHLLTTEAFDIYMQHLNDKGTLAVNITNTYLDLSPVVYALADQHKLFTTRVQTKSDSTQLHYRANWMLLTQDAELVKAIPPSPADSARSPNQELILWTDRYNSLWPVIRMDFQ